MCFHALDSFWMKENGYFITLDLFASLDSNAHNNLVTRVTCTYYNNNKKRYN